MRNIIVCHIRKGYKLKLKSNLEKQELQMLKVLSKCQKRLFVPAEEVAAQKENLYAQKEGNQIDEGSYALNSICQETIVKNLNNKIKKALSRMGIKKLSDQNKYLIKLPMMASCSLCSA